MAHAQVGTGSLKGKITDRNTGEPLPFVNVVVDNRGTQVAGGATDFDGEYLIRPIEPGTYDVIVSYVGYQPQRQTGVVISSNKMQFLNIQLSPGVELTEFEVIQYSVPLIDRDGGASGATVTREDIARMPGRSAASIATTVGGTSDAGTGGGISIRGARAENTYYYIDGVKVPAGAGTGLPKSAIEEVQVITGGVPANYGDVTGGLVNITTRGPSRQFFGGVEYLTSGFKVGDDITDIVGLDKYAFNQVEASLSGPLLFRKDSLGNKTTPLLGFFFSGQYTNAVDNNPLFGGDIRVRPDVRQQLLDAPARLLPNGPDDFVLAYNAEFLRNSDFEILNTRQNAGLESYLASGKIDIATTPTINLSIGGSIDFVNRQRFNRNNSMFNAANNARDKDLTWRTFVKFTQRFSERPEEDQKASAIRNAFYSVQVDYSRRNTSTEDFRHGDRIFDYGHVGTFNIFRAPNFIFTGDRFEQSGFRDTLVTFVPSDLNPDVAAVSDFYFNAFNNLPFPQELLFGFGNVSSPGYVPFYENFFETTGRNALWNGMNPRSVYQLWNNVGTLAGEFNRSQTDQIRLMASGSADIGGHAVTVGIEYEQLTSRNYALAPIGLWTRMRQLTNFHLFEFDTIPARVENLIGTLPFYYYDRLVGSDQPFFDRSLRESLGLDPRGRDFIDIDALAPSAFDLDMFTADELVNNGNQTLVFFRGYDFKGNRLTGKPSFDDFFDARDERGRFTRVQAPFEPIYMAGYVMDKFAFDDIIFNVGVRIDRYDANQAVLRDKYLWQEAYTAGSVVPDAPLAQQLANRPDNIGDDYVVYVDSYQAPNTVVGYRNGDDWFNASGTALVDPTVLRQAGEIQPYLIERGEASDLPGSRLSKRAFRDYTPVINIMPRIAFSFPISDEAVFFAHYDVLTQRPTIFQSRLDLIGYAYLENTGDIMTNPDLRPTKTIDYELGFQQVLSKSSSLKISAFYRELRDQIQIRNVAEAWPRSYRTFDNFDFGTVKGFTTTFDLRRTGNVWMRASYTLQFADGTGSGPTSGISLVNAGLPNLRTMAPLDFDQRHRFQTTVDFRYGGGKDYNGPMLFDKPILERTGINVVSILGSGTPYSRSSFVINEGAGVGNHRLEGSLNGARLPWQFTTDFQVDRDIPLSFGGKDGDRAKSANLNIFLLVTNAFNTRNVVRVYRATGSPDDDGYLLAAQYQPEINNQNDPAAYRDLYAAKVNNPFNFGRPRTIQIGARFDF